MAFSKKNTPKRDGIKAAVKAAEYSAKKEAEKPKVTKDTKPKFAKDSKDYKSKYVKDFKPQKPKVASNPDEIRLNKYISNSGICTRKEADIYIQSGNVKVNGQVVTEMGHKVKKTDEVVFDGRKISPEKKEFILLNKPKNFSTNGTGTTNAYNLIKNATNSLLKPVGRMDSTTTGLLLFTNDEDLIQKFTNAHQKTLKIYQVSLSNNFKPEDFEKIQKGISLDDEHKIFAEEVSFIDDQPKSEIGIKLKTSNVKVVRTIFEKLGYDVLKVDRVVFAGLTKKNLPRGNWRFLTDQEIINLKNM